MDTTVRDPLVGQQLDGRYLIRSRIARGGMATVYLALDQRLDREVALKVMHAHLADDPAFTARFVREARAAARLSHPSVVQVFDQGGDGDLLYLAMEYLRGRTLREVLAEREVLTPREALTVLDPVLDALSAAHRHGIVHRDVKPENVILTDDGRVKVADFGLARAATASTSTTGVLMGTVGYLAPELVVRGECDARSDVYAAGIMLFEMLTGRQPFTGDIPIQVAYQHVNGSVPAPSELAPDLPAALDQLVAAATAREPDHRPADAGELLTRVRAVQAGLTPAQLDARPAGPDPTVTDAAVSGATVGGPAAARPRRRPVNDTEVVAVPRPSTVNVTQALPPELRVQLARGSGDGAAQRPGTLATGMQSRSGQVPVPVQHPVSTEDAELAMLLRRRRRTGMIALLVVVVLAIGLAATAWYFAAGPGAFTRTPALLHQRVEQARAALDSAGLRSTLKDTFSDTDPAGTVVGTDPGPDRPVRKDGTVQLLVSRGPARVKVPDLAGKQEEAARSALAAAFLTADAAQQQFSDAPKGQVLAVDPAAGSELGNGSKVVLTVSKGPQPVEVPDLTGKSRSDAQAALRALRLGWAFGPAKNDDSVPEGSVLSQTPPDGTLLPGQKVTLVLSKGPVLVSVPNVIGQQFPAAREALERAGFQVRRANVLGGFFGTVRLQVPVGGTMAPKGSTVLVTVV